ncbi:dihydroneopterin aldolase [Crenobacter sp. SG2303]|uniref:Dihydroneopterin aldolase n=1 Tax=Crenobacter oryzisoli TaxID=3056844 RepID=A0ABT7XRQ5_9NEIS|nr:dihydroneopterin aldolase [Crenobacter sp. SG2303]MDN0076388.1 dihydroneopterin aldolase [Crenobacter sp. SG2303]
MTTVHHADATRWEIVIDQLACRTALGIYPHEREPQPVLIDAVLHYRQGGLLDGDTPYLDYDRYCATLCDYLKQQPHTDLIEELLIDLLALSFRLFPQLDSAELTLFKPEAVKAARKVGVRVRWLRADFEHWYASQARRTVTSPVTERLVTTAA